MRTSKTLELRSQSIGARSSAGEHYLDMVGVTGSIPVAPTNSKSEVVQRSLQALLFYDVFAVFTSITLHGNLLKSMFWLG